jgi:inorganic pyrophosphatase
MVIIFLFSASATSSGDSSIPEHSFSLRAIDEYTLAGPHNFMDGYRPLDDAGHINVVVEMPTGTTAKWEVDKTSGQLRWEFKHGKPRVVSYLGYPGNYGMIPQTLLPEDSGGDGDPLDVLVLGQAVPRGTVVKARPIGVLRMLDGGEKDDKLIAVLLDSPMGKVTNLSELDQDFPGAKEIVEIWFSNYKGPGKMEADGFGDADQALAAVRDAMKAYSSQAN